MPSWHLLKFDFRLKETFVLACVRCDLFLNKIFKDIWFLWNGNLGFEEMWYYWFILHIIQICTSDDKGCLKQDGILSYCTQESPFYFTPSSPYTLNMGRTHIIIFLMEIKISQLTSFLFFPFKLHGEQT